MQFLIENIFLIAIAFFSGSMLLWPMVRSRIAGPALSTLQVTQLINGKNATIVDIRPPEEFAKGSLPNARNLPANTVKDGARALKKDKPVIVVCANGRQASGVAAQLRSSGFNEVFVLAGGLAAWREAGLPIRT
ncbi:MAG TPA: rhodanese-like domain-containing protein [Burkholderiaceae bacterium]|nr:rhodanese-like domain-containing protein [Burkholderiaceae bacterium]